MDENILSSESIENLIKSIRVFFSRGDLDKAFEALEKIGQYIDTKEFHDTLIQTISKYRNLKNEILTSAVSKEQSNLEQTNLVKSALAILAKIDSSRKSNRQELLNLKFSSKQSTFFKELISKGEIKEILDIILTISNKVVIKEISPFIILSSQLSSLNKENSLGTMSFDDANQQRARIATNLLELISNYHNDDAKNPFGLDDIIGARFNTSNIQDLINHKLRFNSNKSLNLNNLKLTKIPKELNGLNTTVLREIEILDLSNNEIEKIENLSKLINLKELHLKNNKIEKIENLDNLLKLEKLSLNGNLITTTEGLNELTNLQELNLNNNKIEKIENLLFFSSGLNQLSSLKISHNQIKRIENLGFLENLKVLTLTNNEISKIENLIHLEQLTHLLLGENNISKIEGLNANGQLKILELSSNPINTLENLNNQENLEQLYLINCDISQIKSLSKLKKLDTLYLSKNSITSINHIVFLKQLQDLILSENNIKSIRGIDKLKQLQRLDLDNNELQASAIVRSRNFFNYLNSRPENFKLRIHNNPFLEEIKGVKAIDYLAEASANHIGFLTSDYENIIKNKNKKVKIKLPHKLVLLGNSNAGKTSLVEFLIGGDLQDGKGKGSTEILEIKPWKPLKKTEFFIYDFGGQDFYHATYQMFLSKEASYILLWSKDSNKNYINKERTSERVEDYHCFDVNYWLGNIQYINQVINKQKEDEIDDNLPEEWFKHLLLVENKIDLDVDNPIEIDVSFGELEQFKISLLNKKHTLNRKRREWLKDFIQTLHPRLSQEIELRANAINYYLEEWEGLREKQNKWLIAELKTTLEKNTSWEQLDNIDVNRILQRFSHSGMLLWYPNDKILKDYAWIDPAKLQQEVLQLLNQPENKKYKGKIPYDVLEDSYNSSNSILIELLLKKQILFKDDMEGCYIIPQYLDLNPENNPLYQIAIQGLPTAFTIKFKRFMPIGIMNRLIGILGKTTSKRVYARYQIIFSLEDTETKKEEKILLKCDMEHLTIQVSMHNESDELHRKIFYQILLAYHGISIVEETSFNTTSPTTDIPIQEVDRFKAKTIHFNSFSISTQNVLQELDEKEIISSYELGSSNKADYSFENLIPSDLEIALLDDFYISYKDLLKARQDNLNMVIAANSNHSTKNIRSYKFNAFLDELFIQPQKVFISYSHDDIKYRRELQKYLITLKRENLIEIWQDEMIRVGSDWDETIRKNLKEADIIILLISQSFIASDYIYRVELQEALTKHQEKNTIFPILIKDCDYQHLATSLNGKTVSLSKSQLIPNEDGRLRPIQEWPVPDNAWVKVIQALREKINGI